MQLIQNIEEYISDIEKTLLKNFEVSFVNVSKGRSDKNSDITNDELFLDILKNKVTDENKKEKLIGYFMNKYNINLKIPFIIKNNNG